MPGIRVAHEILVAVLEGRSDSAFQNAQAQHHGVTLWWQYPVQRIVRVWILEPVNGFDSKRKFDRCVKLVCRSQSYITTDEFIGYVYTGLG